MTTHVLAFGGGGFSMASNGAPSNLDRYLLELSSAKTPLVCFCPTASADSPSYINRFLTAYGTLGVRTMVLTLWENVWQAIERLPEADVVLVGGGSTVNLMALWKMHGVDKLLTQMANDSTKDLVLGGVSAGGACWFNGCVTDSYGDMRPWLGGVGLLPGSFCPHFDGEEDRVPTFLQAISTGTLPGGYGVDDGAAVHFIDGKYVSAVTERPNAKAHLIQCSTEPAASGVVTEQLDTTLI